MVFGGFAGVALLIAIVGVAGVLAFEMDEGGSLNISDAQVRISGVSGSAFRIVGTAGCGRLTIRSGWFAPGMTTAL